MRLMIPREHGAWAMLLVPFASALVLAGGASWESLAALVAVLAVFLLREPAVELWRQTRVRREPRPGSEAALRWLLAEGAVAALAGAFLMWRLPAVPVAAIGAPAVALTVFSVWLVAHARQRSVALQLVSAAGLNASALLAWLSAGRQLDPLVWSLWALLFAHSAASVLVVHARLEARIAARQSKPAPTFPAAARRALVAQLALAAFASACGIARPRAFAGLCRAGHGGASAVAGGPVSGGMP